MLWVWAKKYQNEKTGGLLIIHKTWPEDCWLVELSMTPPNHPTLRTFSPSVSNC